jgi:hypothetical protein
MSTTSTKVSDKASETQASDKASVTRDDAVVDDNLCFLNTVVYDKSINRFYVDNDFGGNPVYDVDLASDRTIWNYAEQQFADSITSVLEQAVASLNRNKQEGA